MLSIYMELIDDECLEVCFEEHRKLKLGLLCLNCDSVYVYCHKISINHSSLDIQVTLNVNLAYIYTLPSRCRR